MNHLMHDLMQSLREDNADVRHTLDALHERGLAPPEAEDQVAQALMACVWEVTEGLPDRSREVLAGLREGRSIHELFAPERYKDDDIALNH
jgi:hypothetical protein